MSSKLQIRKHACKEATYAVDFRNFSRVLASNLKQNKDMYHSLLRSFCALPKNHTLTTKINNIINKIQQYLIVDKDSDISIHSNMNFSRVLNKSNLTYATWLSKLAPYHQDTVRDYWLDFMILLKTSSSEARELVKTDLLNDTKYLNQAYPFNMFNSHKTNEHSSINFSQYLDTIYVFANVFLIYCKNKPNAVKCLTKSIKALSSIKDLSNNPYFLKPLKQLSTDYKYMSRTEHTSGDTYYIHYMYNLNSTKPLSDYAKALQCGIKNSIIQTYWSALLNCFNHNEQRFDIKMQPYTQNINFLYKTYNLSSKKQKANKFTSHKLHETDVSNKTKYLNSMHLFVNDFSDFLNSSCTQIFDGLYVALDKSFKVMENNHQNHRYNHYLYKVLLTAWQNLEDPSQNSELVQQLSDGSGDSVITNYWNAFLEFLDTKGQTKQNLHDAKVIFDFYYVNRIKRMIKE